MATTKPTAKQLAARKRFTEMAKSGELAKKRKAALKAPRPKGIVKFTAKNAHVEGVKRDGTLKKGYKYIAGGKIVKIKPAKSSCTKKAPAKKKPATKKPVAKKKFLGIF